MVMLWFALVASKKERAFSSSWFRKANADPRTSFVPDLVMRVTAAPPAIPWAASKLFVLILTVSIVSAGATYPTWWGSQMLTLLAPSSRVLLLFGFIPFTWVRSARPDRKSGV